MKEILFKLKIMLLSLFTFPKQEVVAAEGFLPLDLQFFAEPGDPLGDPKDPKDPPADPVDPPKDPKDHMIPKSRFDEVNNNYKTVKDQLDKLLKEKEDAELEAKKKQGEYQTLYEQASQQLETYKTDVEGTKSRVEALEGIMTNMLNSKLESIPEEYHDLIPDNLSPEQKLDWITKAETKGLFGTKSSEVPVGGSTNPPAGKTDLEKMNSFQLLSAGYGSKK